MGRKGLKGKPGDKGVNGSCGTGEELRLNFIKAIHMKLNYLIDNDFTFYNKNGPLQKLI